MKPDELKAWLRGYVAAGGSVPKEVQDAVESVQKETEFLYKTASPVSVRSERAPANSVKPDYYDKV